MATPGFNAAYGLYRSTAHYRASGLVGGTRDFARFDVVTSSGISCVAPPGSCNPEAYCNCLAQYTGEYPHGAGDCYFLYGPCGAGRLCCGGSCVPSDPEHCGTCSNKCAPGENCCGGQCCASRCCTTSPGRSICCPDGTTCCSGTCTNTSSDPANCGGCGNPCATGETCISSNCMCGNNPGCAAGETCSQDGTCLCGGIQCPSGQTCQGGSCGYPTCGGAPCPAPNTCSNGVCTCPDLLPNGQCNCVLPFSFCPTLQGPMCCPKDWIGCLGCANSVGETVSHACIPPNYASCCQQIPPYAAYGCPPGQQCCESGKGGCADSSTFAFKNC